jgi:hypothetical protein
MIRLVVVATGQVITIAGSITAGSADGIATAASFRMPSAVAVTADNSILYVCDKGNNLVRKIVILPALVTTIAGSGNAGFANGVGAAASFGAIWDIALAASEKMLYVVDTGNNRVRAIALAPAGCSAGYHCPIGSSSPTGSGTLCSAGTYCEASTVAPVTCPAGVFCQAGATSPAGSGTCLAGHYCGAGATASNAALCAAGSYCPAGATASGGAGLCAAGSYCPAGSSSPTHAPCAVR